MDVLHLLKGNIIELLGLEKLPDEQKQALLVQMSQALQGRMIDRLIETMSKEQQDEFTKLLDADPSPAQVDAFLMKNVPDCTELAIKEVVKFKEEMINESATVRQIAASAINATAHV
jgi:hypothetical protein